MTGKLTRVGVRFVASLPIPPDLTHFTQDFHKPWESPPFNVDPTPRVPLPDDTFSVTVQEKWEACPDYKECWPLGFADRKLV